MSIEEGKNGYEMVSTAKAVIESPSKTSPDISWVNLNFKAGKANILTECWGKVSLTMNFCNNRQKLVTIQKLFAMNF
jgi:hypothetical protein